MLDYVSRNRIQLYDFFRYAHIWRFERDVDVSTDLVQFKLHAIMPRFVEEYVCHIQRTLL